MNEKAIFVILCIASNGRFICFETHWNLGLKQIFSQKTGNSTKERAGNSIKDKSYYSTNKTIVPPAVLLRLKGGIGNQLFQYACHYAIARRNAWPLYIYAEKEDARSLASFSTKEKTVAVDESILKKFLRRVITETEKIVIGDPLDRSTSHGPQNHRAHLEKLVEFCEIGVKEGATLLYGGHQVQRKGLFFSPTIFTDVEDDMYIAKEESFGPIMIISSFRDGDLEGVLSRANKTEFGLAAGVFKKDLGKALKVSERIHAGLIRIHKIIRLNY